MSGDSSNLPTPSSNMLDQISYEGTPRNNVNSNSIDAKDVRLSNEFEECEIIEGQDDEMVY